MPNKTDSTRRDFIAAAGATLLAAAAQGAPVPLAPPDKQPPDLSVSKPAGKKLGWCIVGLGQLALEEILPAFSQCEHATPVALVSGHPDKANQIAQHYGINQKSVYTYDTFDQIKQNDRIDVVYIVLPNHMHAEYTIRALEAGKHVLCEKPMCTTLADAQKMIDAAKKNDRKLMIAYRLQHEPFNLKMIQFAREKKFGALRLISAQNVQQVKAPNIRLSKETGGGPLGDVGVYCINAARYITGEEPVEVFGMKHQPTDDPRFAEVPAAWTFQLRFPSGVMAHCSCGFNAAESRRYRVMCDQGWFELDRAFGYKGQQLNTFANRERANLQIDPVDHFAAEMDEFCRRIRDNVAPKTPGEEGLADMRVISAIEESARSGAMVKVST